MRKPVNLPNVLTIFRILASFAFLTFGLKTRWEVAFVVFCFAAFTDMVDGTIARLLGQRTRLGAFLDPMADKLLMFFGFLTLAMARILPWTLTALVIARDLLIVTGLVILKWRKVPIVYQPTAFSKVTTFFQIITVFSALLLVRGVPFEKTVTGVLPVIIWLTALLTVATGVQYFRIGLRMLKNEPS